MRGITELELIKTRYESCWSLLEPASLTGISRRVFMNCNNH